MVTEAARGETAEPSLTIGDVTNLANPVADIVPRVNHAWPKRVDKKGDGTATSRYIQPVKNLGVSIGAAASKEMDLKLST